MWLPLGQGQRGSEFARSGSAPALTSTGGGLVIKEGTCVRALLWRWPGGTQSPPPPCFCDLSVRTSLKGTLHFLRVRGLRSIEDRYDAISSLFVRTDFLSPLPTPHGPNKTLYKSSGNSSLSHLYSHQVEKLARFPEPGNSPRERGLETARAAAHFSCSLWGGLTESNSHQLVDVLQTSVPRLTGSLLYRSLSRHQRSV